MRQGAWIWRLMVSAGVIAACGGADEGSSGNADAGSGGGTQNPCAGRPESCVVVCEGGECECECQAVAGASGSDGSGGGNAGSGGGPSGGASGAGTGGDPASGGLGGSGTGGLPPTGGLGGAATGGLPPTGGIGGAATGGLPPTGGSAGAGTGGLPPTGGLGGAGEGGLPPTGGLSGGGSGGSDCAANPTADLECRHLGLPPRAYGCPVGSTPPSQHCVQYVAADAYDLYCCPDEYAACPETPPVADSPCEQPMPCSYGSHPDMACRTYASCRDDTWHVSEPDARCSEPLLPDECPATAAEATGECSPEGTACYWDDAQWCLCTNCSVEAPNCNLSDPAVWECWTPPGNGCPEVSPNHGSLCSLPAGTTCRYTCADIALCNEDGVWVGGGYACPECNSPDTPIATPDGDRPVAALRPGDWVYSVDQGEVVVVPIVKVGARAQVDHVVVRLLLDTGVALEISPSHPTADGRTLGELAPGDLLGELRVVSVQSIPYRHSHTYDILPASDSGTYFAGGVLLASTLAEGRP